MDVKILHCNGIKKYTANSLLKFFPGMVIRHLFWSQYFLLAVTVFHLGQWSTVLPKVFTESDHVPFSTGKDKKLRVWPLGWATTALAVLGASFCPSQTEETRLSYSFPDGIFAVLHPLTSKRYFILMTPLG